MKNVGLAGFVDLASMCCSSYRYCPFKRRHVLPFEFGSACCLMSVPGRKQNVFLSTCFRKTGQQGLARASRKVSRPSFQLRDLGLKGRHCVFRPKVSRRLRGQVIGFGIDPDKYPEILIEIANTSYQAAQMDDPWRCLQV